MAHQAGAYPGFCSVKRLGILLSPWMGCQSIAGLPPALNFAGTHLYTWVERGAVRVTGVLPKNTTQYLRPGLESCELSERVKLCELSERARVV